MIIAFVIADLFLTSILVLTCGRKKRKAPVVEEKKMTPKLTPDESSPLPAETSKQCNSKAGLLSNDHDLRSDLWVFLHV